VSVSADVDSLIAVFFCPLFLGTQRIVLWCDGMEHVSFGNLLHTDLFMV
jgi:hypothetical protein